MSQIDKHFIEEFNQELFVAFQNKGGVMRERTRRKTGVIGMRTHFPKIGTAAGAQGKTRTGRVPLLNVARDRVYCDLQDVYGADMIDKLDELKTNVNEKAGIQDAILFALNRSEDDFALNEAVLGSNSNDLTSSNETWSSDAVPRQILEWFGEAEMMEGGNMYALISWHAWNHLLAQNTFINSLYGGDTRLSVEGQMPKKYFGFDYTPFSRLPKHSSGDRLNLWLNKRVLGVAVGQEITMETDWLPEYHAFQIKGTMSQGAKLIEGTGVIKRRYNPA